MLRAEHTIEVNGVVFQLRVRASFSDLKNLIGDSASAYTSEELECLFLRLNQQTPAALATARDQLLRNLLALSSESLQEKIEDQVSHANNQGET